MGTPAGRTAAAITARRERTTVMLTRVEQALSQIRREGGQVTVRRVALRAQVSATFLYENRRARSLTADARHAATDRREHAAVDHADQQESAWRERALNAEDALHHCHTEVLSQRHRIAELAGHLRDVQESDSGGSTTRLIAENSALQQQLRQLTHEHTSLRDRLDAARTTNRFLDRQLADVEAQLAEQHRPT